MAERAPQAPLVELRQGGPERIMSSRGFQTFLETIRCWLRRATDPEVETLYALAAAERARRRSTPDETAPSPDQPSPSQAVDQSDPASS